MNPDIGRQVSGGEEREPASDVLFAECEGLSGKKNERIEDRAPRDLVVVERVVEMARADGVFSENQRARCADSRSRGPSHQSAWRSNCFPKHS